MMAYLDSHRKFVIFQKIVKHGRLAILLLENQCLLMKKF